MPTLDLQYQAVRHLDDTAIPFILNSWLKSYRWSDKDNADYFRNLSPRIKQLIKTNRVMVATLAGEPDCYVGWVCGTQGVLHYVYVKSVFRRDGIAKALIEKVCGQYGSYTFKSHNNSFLRYLDEKGFEYDEEKQRDKSGLAKNTDTRARPKESDEEQGNTVARPSAYPGTGRSDSAFGQAT